MRSDWDDAPDYIRSNKKPSPWRTVAVLGVGSAIVWALVALFAKSIVIDVNQLKQAIRVDGKPLFSQAAIEVQAQPEPVYQPAPAAPVIRPPTQPLSKAEIEWFEEGQAHAIERAQNLYSDSNYKPRQPDNVYSPPAVREVAAAPTASERRPRTVSRERTAKWIKSWNGGTNYLAEWVAVDNYIDGTSVCANHRRGSIEYRECRKAAKQHYHEQCRSWRSRYDNDRQDHSYRMRQRYCSAASSFSPMG